MRYSVVIPTYNRRHFLNKAVDSVLEQGFDDFELIIIDDGSNDGTMDLINNYSDTRIKYIYQENKGVSCARNRGVKQACGEYIAFLDSDDWWLKNKLEKAETAIKEYPEYKVYHTQEKWFKDGKILNQKNKHAKPSGYIFENCLKLCCVSMSTAVVKRDLFDRIGDFDLNLPVCEDYDFWLRVSVKYPLFLIDEVLTEKEGGHPDQMSRKYCGMDRFRIKSIVKLMDSGTLDKEKHKTAFRELERKCKIYVKGCLKRGNKEQANRYLEFVHKYKRVDHE